MPKRRDRTLIFIFLCLLGSGLFRLADPQIALATEVASLVKDANATPEIPQKKQAIECTQPVHVAQMLDAIKTRQTQLDQNEARFANRMQALNIAEQKLKENTQALIAAEDKLAATLALADSAAEKDLLRLTAVYENMKPKNAAALFGSMAPEFAAGFLGRMRPEPAAEILSALDPNNAYTISLILAGRNSRAPTE